MPADEERQSINSWNSSLLNVKLLAFHFEWHFISNFVIKVLFYCEAIKLEPNDRMEHIQLHLGYLPKIGVRIRNGHSIWQPFQWPEIDFQKELSFRSKLKSKLFTTTKITNGKKTDHGMH